MTRAPHSDQALQRFLIGIEGRAFRIAQIATGQREEALDLVQDAMFKLVRKYADSPEQAWQPLFYTVLQSGIRDWHRRQAVRNRFRRWFYHDDDEEAEDPLEQQPAEASTAPDSRLQDGQFRDHLERALGTLPYRQQQAFLLRVWEGMDISDTAKAMQCSESSVKTHYARALEKLREQLEPFR